MGQPPSWDTYGQQDPGQYQGQGQPPPRPPYQGQAPYRPYDQQPRQPTFAPNPQYRTAPGQPPYQGQPQYPPPPYGQEPYPQRQIPYDQQPYSPQGHRRHSGQPAPRKRRRLFLWVFLAIQALFIIWIIVGVTTVHTGPTQAQLAQGCYNGNWYPLFKSQADCVQHYGGALKDAGNIGKGIGVALLTGLWVAVDVILGIGYGIYRLARRSA
jgi:hypothetical protein